MNMKQIKYVLVLAEAGSFSAASEQLGISQPSLSQYIKKIESQVGVTLFERTNGYVRLTDAGSVYVGHGRKILELEHQMETEFSDIAKYKLGSVIVGTSPYRSANMMPEVAKVFQQKYPGMHLVVKEMVSSDLLLQMEKGLFDLCLTMLPIDERGFTYEKIIEEEMILAVPADYPEFHPSNIAGRKYPAIDIKEIDGGSFVMVTDSQVMQQGLNHLCDEYHIQLKKAVVVKALEAQINMVRKGIGMAVVPTGIERFCNEGEVRFYSFVQNLPRREVVVMWRKDRKQPHVVMDLVSIMKQIAWE